MKIRGKQIPAWILLLIILGAAAAAVAVGSSGATVLTGDTQVAVADKLVLEDVEVQSTSDQPAASTGVVHLANDRQSYMVNFIADEGDYVVVRIKIVNLAGIASVVRIVTDASDYFDIGYSQSMTTNNWDHEKGPGLSSSAQLDNRLRKIDGEWVLWINSGEIAVLHQHIWIKTKPPCPAGQYTIMTWIEQKFQE